MRQIFSIATLIQLCNADLCQDLCDKDGPSLCPNGSWTKVNGDCHGYFFKPNGDYCYHTAETAVECPSTGTPLRSSDVSFVLVASAKGIKTQVLEDEGFWLDRGTTHMFIDRIDLDDTENSLSVVKAWIVSEPEIGTGFIDSMLSVPKALTFPDDFVYHEDLVFSHQALPGNIFDVQCTDFNGIMTGFFRFQFENGDAELPVDWTDRICSMVLYFSKQLDHRVTLRDWMRGDAV
jgi:hypothetical protein